jgi:hypothetical protein
MNIGEALAVKEFLLCLVGMDLGHYRARPALLSPLLGCFLVSGVWLETIVSSKVTKESSMGTAAMDGVNKLSADLDPLLFLLVQWKLRGPSSGLLLRALVLVEISVDK